MGKLLNKNAYKFVSGWLNLDIAVIKALAEVESMSSGYLPDGERPVILFEARVFSRLTNHVYDKEYPTVSTSLPFEKQKHLYKGGNNEYNRLALASSLNREAALKSASWGRFQIMGFNYMQCGYDSVFDYVQAMYDDEANHLAAFCSFIKTKIYNGKTLLTYLLQGKYDMFFKAYNGPLYKTHGYDTRFFEALKKYKNDEDTAIPEPCGVESIRRKTL